MFYKRFVSSPVRFPAQFCQPILVIGSGDAFALYQGNQDLAPFSPAYRLLEARKIFLVEVAEWALGTGEVLDQPGPHCDLDSFDSVEQNETQSAIEIVTPPHRV